MGKPSTPDLPLLHEEMYTIVYTSDFEPDYILPFAGHILVAGACVCVYIYVLYITSRLCYISKTFMGKGIQTLLYRHLVIARSHNMPFFRIG